MNLSAHTPRSLQCLPGMTCLLAFLTCSVGQAANTNPTLSFSAIYTARQLWVQTQAVNPGQLVVVDSLRYYHADNVIWTSDTTWTFKSIATCGQCGTPLVTADVKVWWHLQPLECGMGVMCTLIDSSKSLDLVGDFSWHSSFFPRSVIAIGEIHQASKRIDTLMPRIVYQVGSGWGQGSGTPPCEMTSSADSLSLRNRSAPQILDSLRRRLAKGTVLRIQRPPYPQTYLDSVSVVDSAQITGLGLASSWFAMNQTWVEQYPIAVAQTWGIPSGKSLIKSTGRRVYQYRTPTQNSHIRSLGSELLLSNDSSVVDPFFDLSEGIDRNLDSALYKNDWLILPDPEEVRLGHLTSTFQVEDLCSARHNAYPILGDSVDFGLARVAMSAIPPSTGIATKVQSHTPSYQVRIASQGLLVTRRSSDPGKVEWRILSASGKILERRISEEMTTLLPISSHGLMFVQAIDPTATTVLPILR